MRVATFNVHDRADTVERSLRHADLIFFQEYPPGHPLPAGWNMAQGGKGVVTAWRVAVLGLLSEQWFEAHGSRAGVTPARGTLIVTLSHRRSGIVFRTMNGHRINGWKITREMLADLLLGLGLIGDAGRLRSHSTWRGARYAEHVQLDRNLLSPTLLTIGGGDYNDATPPPLAPWVRNLARGRNDHLWVSAPPAAYAGVRIVEADGDLGTMGSDHRMRRATIRLKRRSPRR